MSVYEIKVEPISCTLLDGQLLQGKFWTNRNQQQQQQQQQLNPTDESDEPCPSSALRIICFHGWMDNCATFDLLIPPFLKQLNREVEIVCIDFAGHGLSSHRPISSHYMLIDHTLDALALVDALGWRGQFGLIGHSMGAAVSSVVSAVLGPQILFTVFIDGFGPFPVEDTVSRIRMYSEQRAYLLHERKGRIYESRDAAVERLLHRNMNINPQSARVLLERGVARVSGEGYAFVHDPRITGPSPVGFNNEQIYQILSGIASPVLFIVAEANEFYKTADAREQMLRRSKVVHDLTVARVPDAHHHVHLDMADVTANIIARFLHRKLFNKSKL